MSEVATLPAPEVFVPASELKPIVHAMAEPRNDSRYSLNAALVVSGPAGSHAIATDGRMMAIRRLAYPCPADDKAGNPTHAPFLLDGAAVRSMRTPAKHGEGLRLNGSVMLASAAGSLPAPVQEGSFPPYLDIVPKGDGANTYTHAVRVNPLLLIRALQAIDSDDPERAYVDIALPDGGNKPIVLVCGAGHAAVLMPVSADVGEMGKAAPVLKRANDIAKASAAK